MLAALCAHTPCAGQQNRQLAEAPGPYRTQEDTVQAVRRLFKSRGSVGAQQLGLSLAGVATSVVLLAAPNDVARRLGRTQTPAVGLGVTSLYVGWALWRMGRFSSRRGAAVVAAYQQGEPLPAYVRRRLGPKYFRAGTDR